LEDRLEGAGAVPWIPDPAKAEKYGKEFNGTNPLIGVFVDHYRRENFRQDGFYDVVVLMVEGVGEVAVHCQATVLANQMHEARPVFGERVGVKYLGERVSAGGTAYSDYKVKVDRQRGGQVQWADAPEPPPAPVADPAPQVAAAPAAAAASPVSGQDAQAPHYDYDGIPF